MIEIVKYMIDVCIEIRMIEYQRRKKKALHNGFHLFSAKLNRKKNVSVGLKCQGKKNMREKRAHELIIPNIHK
jgi:hypothetical protein